MKRSSTLRNKANNALDIPGTKVSITNAQLITSTGSSTLDFFLGGGLAIGTICAIEEDQFNFYSSLLMKYFLAEGVARKHSLFLAGGGDKDPKDFLKELPAIKSVETYSSKTRSVGEQCDLSDLTGRFKAQSLRDKSAAESDSCFFNGKSLLGDFTPLMRLRTQADGVESPARTVSCFRSAESLFSDPIVLGMRLKAQAAAAELSAPKHIECSSDTESASDENHTISEAELLAAGSVPFCSGFKTYDTAKMIKQMMKQAPITALCFTRDTKRSSNTKSEDPLKIAWRYKSQSVEDDVKAESHNMNFDLTKSIPPEEIEKCSISTWVPADYNPDEFSANFLKMPYHDLLNKIRRDVEYQELKTSVKSAETILRIGIISIGSPLWRTGSDEMDNLHLLRFLFSLKALLRTSYAVAVITLPSFIVSNPSLICRIRQFCDTVISLESFYGSDKKSNPLFKDFDGLMNIRKLPVLNTFTYPSMTKDLAFKLKKRGLIIERLHLPPELGDPTPEQQQQSDCSGCGGLGKKMDF